MKRFEPAAATAEQKRQNATWKQNVVFDHLVMCRLQLLDLLLKSTLEVTHSASSPLLNLESMIHIHSSEQEHFDGMTPLHVACLEGNDLALKPMLDAVFVAKRTYECACSEHTARHHYESG